MSFDLSPLNLDKTHMASAFYGVFHAGFIDGRKMQVIY
jgi:hypothetical protein